MKTRIIGFLLTIIVACWITGTGARAEDLGGNGAVERPWVDGAEGALFFDLNGGVQIAGVVTEWSIYTSASHSGTGQLKLKIFRDLGDTWEFIGESPLETVYAWGGVNTFDIPSGLPVSAGDIIAFWYPDGTVPSITYENNTGQTLNNHDWPWEPMPDVQTDIPDLVQNPYWHGTQWDINPRTYSIEVAGIPSSSGLPGFPPNTSSPIVLRGPFPNPVTSSCRIALSGVLPSPTGIGMYAVDGRKVWSTILPASNSRNAEQTVSLDVARIGLAPGSYLIRLSGPTRATAKVTVLR